MSDTAFGKNCPLPGAAIGCREVKLILTDLEGRGEGVPGSPYRRITQLWTHDGVLVAEWDPSMKGDGRA